MISLPTYKIATGVADLKMRSTALAIVRDGLVCHTNLKKRGRLPNAENLSLSLISAILIFIL